MATGISSRIAASTALAFTCLSIATSAHAQLLDNAPEPAIKATDDVGVDLRSGKLQIAMGSLTIGAAASPIFSYSILSASGTTDETVTDGVSYDNCAAYANFNGCVYQGISYRLNGHTDVYMESPRYGPVNMTEMGAMLSSNGNVLTMKDGSVWEFGTGGLTLQATNPYSLKGFVSKITKPDGEILTYNYNYGELISIESSLGYLLHIEGNKSPYYSSGSAQTMQPGRPDKVILINLATDYCSQTAITCPSLTKNWPSMTYSGWNSNNISATDNLGRTRQRIANGTGTGAFKLIWPSGAWLEYGIENWQDYVAGAYGTIICDRRSATSWVKNAGGQWNYVYQKNHACRGGRSVVSDTSTSPSGTTQSWNNGFMDGLGRNTSYTISTYSNFFGSGDKTITAITTPSGSHYEYSFDDRLNITKVILTAADTVQSMSAQAVFPDTCTTSNSKYCNKPTYTVDANGNQTDYTYSADHGGVLTKTLPAGADGVRPQTRYAYQQLYARYKDASGAIVNSAYPVWRLVSTSSCKTQSSCTGTSDEVIEQFTYDDNLLPITKTVKLGDGTVLSTVTTAYDAVGNVISVDGPAAGTDDTTYYFYDDDRESIGEIGPDPDGSGGLQRPAKRRSYNADGKLILEETGTVTGTTQASLAAMSVKQFTRNTYDTATGRLVKTEVGAP